MQKTITVPAWVYTSYHYVIHNWTTVAGVLGVAVIASVVTELIKRYHNKKQLEDLSKKAIAWLLVVFSTLFTALGYAILYAQGHLDSLKTLPIIGSHATEALGLAYTLYNLRLSKYYKAFAAWASKETGKPVPTTPAVASEPGPSEFV